MLEIWSIRKYTRVLNILVLLVGTGTNKKVPNSSYKEKDIYSQEEWKHDQFLTVT